MKFHIPHIEEVLFKYPDYEVFPDLLERLKRAIVTPIWDNKLNYKWDGSMCVFFGEELGKPFVASKSYWNKKKNRKICFSEYDIIRNFPDRPIIQRNLSVLLENLPAMRFINPGLVYGAEFLFHKSDIIETKKGFKFTPNTVTYEFDQHLKEFLKYHDINCGISIHSVWNLLSRVPTQDDIKFLDYVPTNCGKCLVLDNFLYPTTPHLSPELENQFSVVRDMYYECFDWIIDSSKKYNPDQVNRIYTEFIKEYNPENKQWAPKLFLFLNAIQYLKKLILQQNWNYCQSYHRINNEHEGLVYNSGSYTYKIVDRFDFTKRNNEKWGR